MLSGEGDPQYIGGESVQHVLLARAWRDLGHDVSIIVHDEGQGARRVDRRHHRHRGAHAQRAAFPDCAFFIRARRDCSSALMAADADVYYQSPAGAYTGITAWFCRMTGRRFMFRVASDSDCEKEHGRIRFWRDRKLYNYGLRARRRGARRRPSPRRGCCARTMGSRAAVVNMMVEPPRRNGAPVDKDIDVLWRQQPARAQASGARARARAPVAAGEVHAGRRPDAAAGETYYEDVRAAAARLPNVTMLGRGALRGHRRAVRPREDLPQHLEHRGISQHFPAGVDSRRAGGELLRSGRLVQRLQLGRVATSIDDMREAIRGLLEVDVYRENIGRRARDFAAREFTSGVAARYLELLEQKPRA